MSKHTLTGRYFDTIEMIAVNDSWLIDLSAVIAVKDGAAIECDNDLTGNSIRVAGTVTGDQGAIVSGAERTKLSIAASGLVVGVIDFGGSGSSITNAGRIISSDLGIGAEGGNIKLSNSGTIDAATIGVFADALHGAFVNSKTGIISGGEQGVKIYGDQGVNQRIVNAGHIDGGLAAIEADAANDTIINTGKITGDVNLGPGDDVFDTRHGVLKGKVEGGLGADILITDSAKVHLIERTAEGFDRVQSTVSYKLNMNVDRLELIGTKDINATGKQALDSLVGNSGDNIMKGLGGPDIIDGGKGNDRLIGGGGNDTFGFAAGYARDEIVDFLAGDKVYIHNWGAIGDFGELKSHSSDHGADVWITAGHDTLILDHIHKVDLQASDFQF
jgi:Ca2+-binding RTX toxin-like protein